MPTTLSAGKPARSFDFDEGDAEQQAVLHEMGLLSAKPVLYACNVGEDDLMEASGNKYVPLVAARAKEEGARYIPICQDRGHCRLLSRGGIPG